MKKYCITQCSMRLLDTIIRSGNQIGWCYEKAVGNSEILIVGDIRGESKKIRQATRLGVKTVSIADILEKGLLYD